MNSVSGTCSIQASRNTHTTPVVSRSSWVSIFSPEVDFEGLVNGQAQSERTVFPLGKLQSVLEPPARRAVEEAADLAGRQDGSRFGCSQPRRRSRLGTMVSATSGATISSVEVLSGGAGKQRQFLQGRRAQLHQRRRRSDRFSALIPCHTSLPHGLDEHGQPDGPDIFAGELQRIVAHAGS